MRQQVAMCAWTTICTGVLVALVGCSSSSSNGSSDAAQPDATQPDTETPTAPPIATAMSTICPDGGNPGKYPNSLEKGDDLHKVTLNAPGAVCNDGSPGIFFIRAATDPAHANDWVLYVQGGGGCTSHKVCLSRWCGSQGANYDMAKMSTTSISIESIGGTGIFSNQKANPFRGYNHVFIYYCSSDNWVGQADEAVLTSEDGTENFSMMTRGHTILEAVVARLKAGMVTSDDGVETVPDLDEASVALWTGVSAGSNGATYHLDWFAGQLNSAKTKVYGVLDGAFKPSSDPLPEDAAGALEAHIRARYEEVWLPLYKAYVDESCSSHDSMQGDDAWRCSSATYLKFNHLTTPFFQRQDLRDSVTSKSFMGACDPPGEGPCALEKYAEGEAVALGELGQIGTTAAEAAVIDFTPGAYGSNCTQHVAITNNKYFLTTTVEDAAGTPTSFAEALLRWLNGEVIQIIDGATDDSKTSICAAVTEDLS